MYVTTVMGLCVISTMAAIMIVFLNHYASTTGVSPMVQKIFFRSLAPALCMSNSVPKKVDNSSVDNHWVERVHNEQPIIMTVGQDCSEKEKDELHDYKMGLILSHLHFIKNQMKAQNMAAENQEQWKALARVLDRLFFWICLLGFIVACLAIFGPVFTTGAANNHLTAKYH